MSQEKLPFVDIIHPQSDNCVTGVRVKATGDSELNDSLDLCYELLITL